MGAHKFKKGAHMGAHSRRNTTIFYGILLKQKNTKIVWIAVKQSICCHNILLKPQYIVLSDKKEARFSSDFMAGAEGLEPSARGFGDRCSTN